MPVRPCGNAFNFSGDSLCNSGGSGGGGGGGGAFTGRQFDCGNEVDQIYTRIPTGAWNGSPQGNNMCDQNSPNYSPQLSPGGQFSSPGRPMTFPQRSPNLNRSPQDPRNQSYGCNEASSPGSPNIGRPIKPSDFFTPPARAPQRGTHLTMATQIPQNQYNETYDQTSYLNLPDCEPAGRQMNAQQGSPNFNAYPPGAFSTPYRGPQNPQTYTKDFCDEEFVQSSYPQQPGPNRPMDFQQQQRRQPLSEVKVSSAGRAFNSGDKCSDDVMSGLEGLPIGPIDVGYVEPGSPQWISLYMSGNYTHVPGYYQPKNSNEMRNRSPSPNRYDCDPSGAKSDSNANQQLYRNQAYQQAQQSPCPCPRPGASANQARQMQPWNQPDCSPPRMPGSRDRSYSPSGGAPCPCPSGTGAGAQSNVNMSRNQQGAASMSGQQQDTCCSRPMQRQAQQQLQQQQQQYVHQLIQQNLQIELARRNSPDCSVTRGVIPKRSDASFKASASAAKASSTPKASTSGLSMRELCNRKLRELQMENLVRDQYIPGVIQETLDGCENFNCVSFDLTLGQEAPDNKPQVDPLTLVEAFAMRIEYERNQVNCARERNAKGKEKETDPEKIKKNEKQEIDKYFACQNDSELNRAIAGLLRAERIEELTNDVKPLFTTEISKKETTLPGSELNNFQDLTMITYTSTTKPT